MIKLLRALALAVFALLSGMAQADTSIALFQSYAGNVNFTGTQKTIRTNSNSVDACSITSGNVNMVLSGIPSGAVVLAAHLYWAGSGSTSDTSVTMDGAAVSAPSSRRWTSNTVGYDYFANAADVTTAVRAKGNGTYVMSGLSIDSSSTYCNVEGVLGGFQLVVIYSKTTETYRVLNLYEGLQYVRFGTVSLTLSNFQIPSNPGAGRIGAVTWEGDSTLSGGGERLTFNGTEMTDANNTSGNQFNSYSNINSDASSYGIDFDAYNVNSPVIAAGQTSATTTFESGQDLVLMNAEIIAVPNTPVSDLGLVMTADAAVATLGQNVNYSISIRNYGTGTSNTVTVTDTFPSKMLPLQAAGNGWTCSISGQTVTCTSTTAVPYDSTSIPNSTYPTLTITAQVVSYTNTSIVDTATLAGGNFDNISVNNSATVTLTADYSEFVFTDSACVKNIAFGAAGQTCNIFHWDTLTTGNAASVYITVLGTTSGGGGSGHGHGQGHGGNSCANGNNPHCGGSSTGTDGVPFSSSSSPVSTNMYFGLSCVKPITGNGIQATFGSVTLPVCASSSATPSGSTLSSAMNVTFPGNSPSSGPFTFRYNDAGRISLYMTDSTGSDGASGNFVSRPTLGFFTIKRNSDNALNAANQTTPSISDKAFVKAGEAFTITVAALSTSGAVAPNYGREAVGSSGTNENFVFTVGLPSGTNTMAGLTNIGTFSGSFGSLLNGQATGSSFAWSEVGMLELTLQDSLNDYLGTGAMSAKGYVGRFVPDHFDTAVSAPMTCSIAMGCNPTVANGAAYSGQPITTVTVTARNSSGAVTQNFCGNFVPSGGVPLSAYDAAGGNTANPGGGSMSTAKATFACASSATYGIGTNTDATYTLPNAFVSTAPKANNWTVPTDVFVRASYTDTNAVGSGSITVTSKQSSGSTEGSFRSISGRMNVANTYGSELLPMPVVLTAQFYNSSGAWVNNASDVSASVPLGQVFSACTGGLNGAGGCQGLVSSNTVSIPVRAGSPGVFDFRLRAPGSGFNGTANLTFSAGGWPVWLPSMSGKLVFGTYRSPLIYYREVY